MRKYFMVTFSAMIFFLIPVNLIAQDFRTPRPSPDATVTQYVGITKITIDYSSPGVKGRKIWGELVPYGEIWRTGANEVTSFTFSTPVKINGTELTAGTYGVHMIPGESQWEIVLSSDTEVDGSSAYDPTKDALRFKVTPQSAPFTERMIFTITDMTDNSANINLMWENLKISFPVEVNTEELTIQSARQSVNWATPFSAATYCLQKNINLEEGYRWIEASVLLNENYWNLRIKAQYLAKMDMIDEAIDVMENAVSYGEKMEQAPFDFENMKKMLAEWKGE
ncbi:MAG: DUF2911 domain-containing protein [Ignavibacteriaceae bacterium]